MEERTKDVDGEPFGGIEFNGDPCLQVKSLMEYIYMKWLRLILRVLSGWPSERIGEKPLIVEGKHYAIFITIISLIYFALQLHYVIDNAHALTFIMLGHMYIAILMNLLCTSRAFTLSLSEPYKNVAVSFLTEVHVFHHRNKSDYSRLIYAQVHKMCNFISIYLTGIMFLAIILFNMVPFYMNYKKGNFQTSTVQLNVTYDLAIYFGIGSFDPERKVDCYWYAFVMNWVASFLCASGIIMYDLLLSIIIFNLWGHFKILLHALDAFPLPSAGHSAHYSPVEQTEVSSRLRESIIYHRFIVDFTNAMSQSFGLVLFIYYTFHQISGCLMLLECAQGTTEALARYLPLTVMMFAQLIQISIIFEIIGTMSEKLKDSVYCLPWECMNSKNRSTVMLFLTNVQNPIHLKAGGLIEVGVTTMASILKGSFSYFAFLRTMS